jgi:hypothetical protein
MAIHPDHPGLKAEVIVNGSALAEFDDNESLEHNTTTRYVEAVAGEHFGIRIVIPPKYFETYSVEAVLRVDGTDMRHRVFRRTMYRGSGVTTVTDASAAYIEGESMA